MLIALLIVLMIFLAVGYSFQIIFVLGNFLMGEYYGDGVKKFLMDLIPFYPITKKFIEKWRELKE